MSNQPFKPGDVVRLKSGGPVMTVETIGSTYDDDVVNCVWFEKTKQTRGQFQPAALSHFERPGPINVTLRRA